MSEIQLTGRSVRAAVSGTIVSGDPSAIFHGVSIDTRTITPGQLFIAIRGERFDGAEFADAAVAAGAAGLVMPRGRRPGAMAGGNTPVVPVVIEVEDTTSALQSLARTVRRESGTRVVAITGSAGKTTTKEVTAEFLEAKYRVIRNRGNFNNHIGLPLSLMDLRRRPDVAVVELGMNHAGEISTLVGIAEPDVRVWTNVGEAHLGFFGSIDDIADAKAEILESATPSIVLVSNADDDRIVARTRTFAGRAVTFGMERRAAVHASAIVDRGIDGMSANVSTPHGKVEITTPLLGRANLANVLAATAVAIEMDVPLAETAERARTLKPAAHRGEVIRMAGGITIIDDSYNANPTATRRALEVLAGGSAIRRVAVIGEMLELGESSVALHEQVGRAARQLVDVLVAIGGEPALALARAAIRTGMPKSAVHYFTHSDDAAQSIARLVRAGDIVLVKGSRGIRTDRIVDQLKAELA